MAVKYHSGVAYDTDTDYWEKMEAAAAAGSPEAAAAYERQRNAKIAGEGLNYARTDRYGTCRSAGQTAPTGFTYDPESDPLYRQYRAQYERSGALARDDTLAQLSARTGGLASSYAGQAAQQTYNGYMQALNDKLPELYQLAYERYLQEQQAAAAAQSAAEAAEQTRYDRAQDAAQQQLTLAKLAAQYGDYSLLNALGIDTAAKTAGTGKSAAASATSGEGIPQALYRQLYKSGDAAAIARYWSRMTRSQQNALASVLGMTPAELRAGLGGSVDYVTALYRLA